MSLRDAPRLGLSPRTDVERYDPRPDGTLLVQVRGGHWYHCDDELCRRSLPATDTRLPLARRLSELADSGDVEVLSYRPGRRLVVRHDDEQGGRILKGYRRRRLQDALRRQRRGAAGLEGGPLRTAPVIDVDDRASCLVMEDVQGRPLDLSPRAADRLFRVGVSLRRLQENGRGRGLPAHGAASELSVLEALCGRARQIRVPVPDGWDEVFTGLERNLDRVADVRLLLAHRDLHDGQLLEVGPATVLLDFDLLCRADPLLDAANLLAHMKLRELQAHAGAVSRTVAVVGGALLDGLDRNGEADARVRLRFYEAATFLRLAVVYALRPRWKHLTGELLELARRCYDELP